MNVRKWWIESKCFFVFQWVCLFFLFASMSLSAQVLQRREFLFSCEPIDVVIPCCKKDIEVLKACIASVKKCVQGVRRVIVVSSEPLTKKAEWIDERAYPFTKKNIAHQIFSKPEEAEAFVNSSVSRVGWIYQQLLKLYTPYVIPGISSNILIVDADVIFLQKVSFLSADGSGLYAYGSEYHSPYFSHMHRLLPGLGKIFCNYSGVAHHMLFQKPVLDALFADVEHVHNKEFWKAFCDCIDKKIVWGSCASEYEIYFNYVFRVSDQPAIRPLKWKNICSISDLSRCRKQGYHYVACHSYARKE